MTPRRTGRPSVNITDFSVRTVQPHRFSEHTDVNFAAAEGLDVPRLDGETKIWLPFNLFGKPENALDWERSGATIDWEREGSRLYWVRN